MLFLKIIRTKYQVPKENLKKQNPTLENLIF